MTDTGDPDDWRPNSAWTVVADDRADMAVIVEEPGVGDAIPLHRHRIDEVLFYDSAPRCASGTRPTTSARATS
jgi:hypothetical protein